MTPDSQTNASDGTPIEWWFNAKTGQVESGRQTAAPYRLGPFDSEAAASRALEILAQRAAAIQLEDEED